MLTLSFRFPGGRYHATPWGRHVNEATVPWPPEPWRLLRALIATWHKAIDNKAYSEALLADLIDTLAGSLPRYRLPPAVLSHTRHYMPDRRGKPSLVFDGFARLDPAEPLVIAWPAILELPEEQAELLDVLLARLPYLGRAESWVDAARMESWEGELDCVPLGDSETGVAAGAETVTLLASQSAGEYAAWRAGVLTGTALTEQPPAKRRQIAATLPERLLDALRNDNGVLRKVGWSLPPGALQVRYRRPTDALATSIQIVPLFPAGERPVNTARFQLYGKPLPRVEDTLRMAERVRAAVMGMARHMVGDQLPALLSGHGLPSGNRHEHAFYLPEDADGDGRIDHVIIHVPAGLDAACCAVLDTLRLVRGRDGQEWHVLLEWLEDNRRVSGSSALLAQGQQFISVTPYLHPWYAKKRFGVAEQIRRECRLRRLPLPEVALLDTLPVLQRRLRPVHFRRIRSRKGMTQPDTRGCFCRLVFPEPVRGPLALGFGCHFGMGLFSTEAHDTG